ncbi:MAG: hypothetical protein JST42_22105 [Bacteroidetes bacterium]|nr:hypothetical protein [Bacteroidota bacterium]
MKIGVKFILTYYGLSILFMVAAGQVVKGLAGETMSYLLWFYIYSIVIGIIVFPVTLVLVRKLDMRGIWRLVICFFVLLLLFNVPFFFDDGRIITVDAIKDGFSRGPGGFGFNRGGIHLVAIVSFAITGWIFRKEFKDG